MPNSTFIVWDAVKLRQFKCAIAYARARDAGVFTFNKHKFVTGYAAYLAEYLESRFDTGCPTTTQWHTPTPFTQAQIAKEIENDLNERKES